MIAFFAQSEGGLSALRLPFFIGLVFSLLGDVFFNPATHALFFVTGMGAFAIAHLAYIYGYTQWGGYPTGPIFQLFFALVVLVLAFNFISKHNVKKPVCRGFKSVCSRLMGGAGGGHGADRVAVFGARGLGGRVPAVMAGLGGSFFMVSDL